MKARSRFDAEVIQEMSDLLGVCGYDPDQAEKLFDEGMGTFELEERLRHTPGAVGSLEYTHRLKKMHPKKFDKAAAQQRLAGWYPAKYSDKAAAVRAAEKTAAKRRGSK